MAASKPTNVLQVVLKDAVCLTCNGGWMSLLEKAFVKTLGTQLSTPTPVTIDLSQQERVARWATKVALLLQLYTGTQESSGHYVPPDNLKWLARHSVPPPGTRVWIGALRNPGRELAHYQGSSLTFEWDVPVAYFVTFTLGYLIFQVFGREILDPKEGRARRELPTLNPPPMLGGTITELWPGNGDDSVWPTPKPIESAALPQLENWPSQVIRQPRRPGSG